MDRSGIKTVHNPKAYVQALFAAGVEVIRAEKFGQIMARQGTPGETVVSWSTDANGEPVEEKVAEVTVDVATRMPDWIVTKVSEWGDPVIDRNGHANQWIITDKTFRGKYDADPNHEGVFIPKNKTQRFVRLSEPVGIVSGGKMMYVDAGGYINVTNTEDIYAISSRDFEDTYRVI